MNLTDNEKKIITLLSTAYPKSKKDITRECGIGWATAVKMVSRLEDKGIIECVGTGVMEQNGGKNAYVYQLAYEYPLSIGIDVEYLNTNLILHNLKGDVLGSIHYKTPIKPGIDELKAFLHSCIEHFMDEHRNYCEKIIGIGIGMPLWILNDTQRSFDEIAEYLSSSTNLPVQIENNIHNYAIHEKWHGNAFPYRDFVIVTIRNGLGSSIFLNGHIVKGAQGVAGEIGHLQMDEDGQLCHCGKSGCLETLINQNILYTEYVQQVLQERLNPEAFTDEHKIAAGLADLMTQVKRGNSTALNVIEQPVRYLSIGIAALTLLLNIPTIFIVAHFGEDGDAILPIIEQELRRQVVPNTAIDLHYLPLQELSFTKGASLLNFSDYFIDG
ncbi:MAG: ROK family transcriptional regulator [Spirochaetota bacterium]